MIMTTKNKNTIMILVLIAAWILTCFVEVCVLKSNQYVMFSGMKVTTWLIIVVIAILLSQRSYTSKRDYFYLLFLSVLLCSFVNYVINFISHFLVNSVTVLYCEKYALLFLSLLCTIVCLLIIWKKNIALHKIFVIVGLLIGCSYLFVMTPLSIPDEQYHYQSSYIVSNQLLFVKNKNCAVKEHIDYSKLKVHENSEDAYTRMSNDLILGNDSYKKEEKIDENYSKDYPIQYIPQAIGISIARLLHMNFGGVFYLGRFTNLLFFIICVYFAIKTIPVFKEVMFCTAILPMSIHQAASFSSDSFINGLAFLLISVLVFLIIEKEPINRRTVISSIIISMLLSPAKIIYVLITFLAIVIPTEKFKSVKKKVLFIISIIGFGFLAIAIVKYNAIIDISSAHINQETWAGARCYVINDVIEDPINTVKIYLKTIKHYGIWYFETMLGSTLSGLTIKLPSWIVYVLIFTFTLVSLDNGKEKYVFRNKDKMLMILIIASSFCAVLTAMFLGWTPIFSDIILGVQGRYFLPLLPIISFVIRNTTIQFKRHISNELIAVLVVTHSFILSFVINYTF